jgi:cysteine desulfurase
MLYFDYNATTPLLPQARQAWLDASERFIGNPSSPHRLGSRAEAALQQAREKLARWLGCAPLDIVWTSGATESNNMVLHHLSGSLDRTAEVWVSAIEHPCVLAAARRYFGRRQRLIPVTSDGVVDLEWIGKRLRKRRAGLIAAMAANNETGVLQPWRELLTICRQHSVPFFCDAAQWIGKLPAAGLGQCDFVSGCAHKFGGPKGVGFLKVPAKGHLHPLLVGGKQEEARRAGTENVAGVLSMIAALEARNADLEMPTADANSTSGPPAKLPASVSIRLKWRKTFEDRVLKALPGSEVVGHSRQRLWNTVSALMPAADCRQRWVVKLDKLGYAVSTGSACASGREEPSHVLAAMGYSPAAAGRVLRFSSGWETTEQEWLALLGGLEAVWAERT